MAIQLQLDAFESDADKNEILKYADNINEWGTTLATLANITTFFNLKKLSSLKSLDNGYTLKQMLSFLKRTHSSLKAFNWYSKITVTTAGHTFTLYALVENTMKGILYVLNQ